MRSVLYTLLLSQQDAFEECCFKQKDIAAYQSQAAAARKPQDVQVSSSCWTCLSCAQSVKEEQTFKCKTFV